MSLLPSRNFLVSPRFLNNALWKLMKHWIGLKPFLVEKLHSTRYNSTIHLNTISFYCFTRSTLRRKSYKWGNRGLCHNVQLPSCGNPIYIRSETWTWIFFLMTLGLFSRKGVPSTSIVQDLSIRIYILRSLLSAKFSRYVDGCLKSPSLV